MTFLNGILLAVAVLSASLAVGHALIHKREPRAAMGWIGFCVTFPLAGPLCYFLFGINRIRTRARKLHAESPTGTDQDLEAVGGERTTDELVPDELRTLAHISDAVSRHALVSGNAVEILHNGEAAYPAMLDAIDAATRSVLLASYIFDANETGQRFINALARAVQRGVEVRVLLDGYGEIYSSPRAGKELRRRGVPLALFIPPKLIPPTWHLNLRNHRKILVADHVAFVSGMNIGDRHLVDSGAHHVVGIQFRFQGPVVPQIAQVFWEDWEFATGRQHTRVIPSSSPSPEACALCRTITDGPNEDLDRLATILVGAVSSAQRRVVVMTPYFLPPRELIAAFQSAALRGVEVVVILPAKNNLPYVHWATRNLLWELLLRDVRVVYQPPPFVHSKLFLVDDHYALVGSANLDPRSLRLNFELGVEIFDERLVTALVDHCAGVLRRSREVTLTEVDSRPLWQRLRDSVMWLFSPYL